MQLDTLDTRLLEEAGGFFSSENKMQKLAWFFKLV